MASQRPNRNAFAPIPTYDEAVSSSSNRRQAGEPSTLFENEELLPTDPSRRNNYARYQPRVESVRSSHDAPRQSTDSGRASLESLQREVEEIGIDDSAVSQPSTQSFFTKHLPHSISSLQLQLPRFSTFTNLIPERFRSRGLFKISVLKERLFASKELVIIAIIRGFALLAVVAAAYLVFYSGFFKLSRGRVGPFFDPESVKRYVTESLNETQIRENLRYLTSYDHIAGTKGNYVQAKFLENEWTKAGLEAVTVERFDVYANYPRKDGRRVSIIEPKNLRFEAKIEEDQFYTDPYREQTYVFHGYSREGNVTGPLVYANYGSTADFEKLKTDGIVVKGAIVIVRYGGSNPDRALKVKAAENAGAVGVLMYSDPHDDGYPVGPVWPDGKYRPDWSVQRGTVAMTSFIAGDPLSPGFASFPGDKHRISKDNNPALVNIPSIPLGWRDAEPLLRALKGHGKRLDEGDGRKPILDDTWWTGNITSPIVHLQNFQDEEIYQPFYNVLGKIEGYEEPEKTIVIGNHRDAWCYGAVDPSSGTAVLLELARTFGSLKAMGWRPLRTIVFASWDGEEYNLVGSTEHVEARINDYKKNGIAYINVDVAVAGTVFGASGSPIFRKSLEQSLERVFNPFKNKNLLELFREESDAKIDGVNAGTDYLAFQDFVGVSSLNIGFEGFYPYHSVLENFEWVMKFGDSSFAYHKMLAQVWGLVILEFTERHILPFDMPAYADAFESYVEGLAPLAEQHTLDLKSLRDATGVFKDSVRVFEEYSVNWHSTMLATQGMEPSSMTAERVRHNERMVQFDKDLLDAEGLPNRTQYKHVLSAPDITEGYDVAYLPSVRDALGRGDVAGAQRAVENIARIVKAACDKLVG